MPAMPSTSPNKALIKAIACGVAWYGLSSAWLT